MLSDFLLDKLTKHLKFSPNEEQKSLLMKLSDFLLSKESKELFLLKGYAGTGKTSIAGALIKTMTELKRQTVLLAPTGRAAKIMSNYSEHKAYTIHKKIYIQKSTTEFYFKLNFNPHKNTLFIVDEASMINNYIYENSIFGSGKLLDDLISYVYQGEGCKLILMGDDAQLTPIGQKDSPALNATFLKKYNLDIEEFNMHKVSRQAYNSGILNNATYIRNLIKNKAPISELKITTKGFNDITRINGSELIDSINKSYEEKGVINCSIIVKSNKQASIYNKGIRNQILQREDEIGTGDLIIITKNNYFWGKEYEGFDFIANGNIAKVIRIIKHHEMYGLHYADLIIKFIDYEQELEVRILLESLYADTPQATDRLNKKSFETIIEDYKDIKNQKKRIKELNKNEYYNALQIKFAYAITCHKAQGGQWDSVYIDQGLFSLESTEDYYHWLYTAITRTIKHLYIINFPQEYIDNER